MMREGSMVMGYYLSIGVSSMVEGMVVCMVVCPCIAVGTVCFSVSP